MKNRGKIWTLVFKGIQSPKGNISYISYTSLIYTYNKCISYTFLIYLLCMDKLYVCRLLSFSKLLENNGIFSCLVDIFCYLERYSDSFIWPSRSWSCVDYQLHKIILNRFTSGNAERAFSCTKSIVKQIWVIVNRVPKYYGDRCRFQKWHSWCFHVLKKIFRFN